MNDVKPECVLVAVGRSRDPGRLDCRWRSDAEPPPLESLIETASTAQSHLVIGGGEPTLRNDFPEIVAHFGKKSVIATDGLALHTERTVKAPADKGLSTVRIPIHSARSDAHDWLVGIPGAHRRIRQAIPMLRKSGITVHAEVSLNRPTVAYLEETVAFLMMLGIRNFRFRMLRRLGAQDNNFVTTAPRYGLMQPSLDTALRTALRAGASVELQGVPQCAIPGFADLHIPDPEWLVPTGMTVDDYGENLSRQPCECKWPKCKGPRRGYTDLFGWSEFESEQLTNGCTIAPVPRPASGDNATPPPPRHGRQPSTRISDVLRLSEHANVGGDPMAGRTHNGAHTVVAIRFPAEESTRSIKMRLVHAAQQGAGTLQIAGTLDHPHAIELVREALRLSFSEVVITGDLGGFTNAPNNKLFQLRSIKEIWIPNTPSNIAIAERIKLAAKVDYRIIKDHNSVEGTPLHAPVGTAAARFIEGHSWPQWQPNAVHLEP